MNHSISLKLNGNDVTAVVESKTTLLQLIRDHFDLTGTKEGCGVGECGACTVLLDGEPVYSCLMFAVEADGREVVTIEGLAQGDRLHPLQEAFRDFGAVQCGYCSPGMLLTASALLKENPQPTEQEVRMAIAGNICRCTGYSKIVQAILATAKKAK